MSTRASAIRWTPHSEPPADHAPDEAARSSYRLATGKKVRTTWLYGDGTPSPYSDRFFELARHAVDCGVELLHAHVAIGHAAAHRQRLLEAARTANEAEWAAVDVSTAKELPRARALADAGRGLAQRAIEAFLLKHDMPGTRYALRMVAQGETYAAHAAIATPFGVEAELDLWIPEHHLWREVRRVGDVMRSSRGPCSDSGLHSKGAMMKSEALDALYITALDVRSNHIVLTLRETARAAHGYRLHFDSTSTQIHITLARIAEDGTTRADLPMVLASDERAALLRLWKRLVESTGDLLLCRRAVVATAIDGRPMRDGVEPRLLCERLVGAVAPMLSEIARRSSALGAVVLIRDNGVDADEVRLAYADLQERIASLPRGLQSVFDPLDLRSL